MLPSIPAQNRYKDAQVIGDMVARDMLASWYDTKRLDKNQSLVLTTSHRCIVVCQSVGNGNAAIALAASDGSLTDALNVLAAIA